MSARRGFTLVEVVVVLLVIALATAFTVPALLQPRVDDDLTLAARRIDALFRLARDSAVRGGVPITVAIDSATAAVWLVAEQRGAGAGAGSGAAAWATPRPAPPNPWAAGSARDTGASLELPSSVRLEVAAARARWVFTPGGAAFGDTLVLRTTSRAMTIALDPWTGDAVAH